MKIVLAQNSPYLPLLGGANKGNRLLMEMLADRGHTCTMFTASSGQRGFATRAEFLRALGEHAITAASHGPADVFHHRGVEVHAFDRGAWQAPALQQWILQQMPDWILVSSEDPGQILLEAAVGTAPERVICLVRTLSFLPFGPYSFLPGARRTELMRQAGRTWTLSRYSQDYVRRWAGIDAEVAPLISVTMGPGPFPCRGRLDNPWVTLINPCAAKGLSIFLLLADALPGVRFAAVPTGATTDEDRAQLMARPNVDIIAPQDDIDIIFGQTRALLVPSLYGETWGRVIREAMLRAVPVLASDHAGCVDAKLGVEYLLPVRPMQSFREDLDDGHHPVPVVPPQDVGPWRDALRDLLGTPGRYEQIAKASQVAALEAQGAAGIDTLEALFQKPGRALPVERAALRRGHRPPARADMDLSPDRRAALALMLRARHP